MNAYSVKYIWVIDEKEYNLSYGGFCLAEKPNNRIIEINWNNILDFTSCCPFNIFHRKKGMIISSSYLGESIKDIKEWKNPNFTAMLKVEYKETTVSIDNILKYHNGEKAIQYLIERGITINK